MGIKKDLNLLVNPDKRRVTLKTAAGRAPISSIINSIGTDDPEQQTSDLHLVPPLTMRVTAEEKIEIDVVPDATKVEVSRATQAVLTDDTGKEYLISAITWPS